MHRAADKQLLAVSHQTASIMTIFQEVCLRILPQKALLMSIINYSMPSMIKMEGIIRTLPTLKSIMIHRVCRGLDTWA